MSNKVTRVYQDGKKLTLEEIVGKLTPKQRKFAEGLVFGGLSKAEALEHTMKHMRHSLNCPPRLTEDFMRVIAKWNGLMTTQPKHSNP